MEKSPKEQYSFRRVVVGRKKVGCFGSIREV